MELQKRQLRLLNVIVRKGLDQASLALLKMTDGGVELAPPALKFMPLDQVPAITGNAAETVVSVYVGVDGDVRGHAMMMMSVASACDFADMLMNNEPGTTTTLQEMTLSALSEAGNVGVSGFLNALADDLKLQILPSTPQVVVDMAGAILEGVVVELYLRSEDVLVIETGFVGDGNVPGHFLLLLDRESRTRLIDSLGK